MPSLSIIIVNYRSAHLILDCLESIYRFNETFSFEVVVADNSNEDGEKETVLQRFPQVRWIHMNDNAGFARANNTGMKSATGDVFLLLNPDTLAVDNSIEKCFEVLQASTYVA